MSLKSSGMRKIMRTKITVFCKNYSLCKNTFSFVEAGFPTLYDLHALLAEGNWEVNFDNAVCPYCQLNEQEANTAPDCKSG